MMFIHFISMIKAELNKTFIYPLKKDTTLKKLRPSKISAHIRDKMEKQVDELIKAGITRKQWKH